MDYSPLGSSVHGISQTRILGQGCHFLLQGIFLTQGWKSSYLPRSRILYHNLGGYISELGFDKGKPAKNLRVMSLGYHSVLFCPGPSVAAHECINAYALAWGRWWRWRGISDNSQLVMISKINGERLPCSIMPISEIHLALLNACFVKDPKSGWWNSHKNSNHENSWSEKLCLIIVLVNQPFPQCLLIPNLADLAVGQIFTAGTHSFFHSFIHLFS